MSVSRRNLWLLALFVVASAHALVAIALVNNWRHHEVAGTSAPIAIHLAMVDTASAPHSQIAEIPSAEKPQFKLGSKSQQRHNDINFTKAAVAETSLSEIKDKPESRPEVSSRELALQEQMTHINAPMNSKAQARQSGGSEQLATARQKWYDEVLALLQKQKRYPRLALLRSEQGVVKVRFELDREGRLLNEELVDSSGFHSLDKEALALVHRVSLFPPPPAAIAGSRISLVVPVAFQVTQ
jgi:protein TonB